MQQFKNVDVVSFLEQVMKSNTKHHQEDFEIDKKALEFAMRSDSPDDKYLVWLSRENGTHCLKENDIFIKESSAFYTWQQWAEPKRDEKIIAFAIHITGSSEGKPIGDVYELDYTAHAEMVKNNALSSNVKVLHFEHGDIRLPSTAPTHISPDINYGEYINTEYIPHNWQKFYDRIFKAHSSYENLPEGNAEEYLSSLNEEPFHFVLWSNLNLDYEEGIEFARENYPDEPEDRLMQRYIEENDEMLETERLNLDIQYNQPIIIIGDLGLWNGRAHGYKDIPSGNIKDCLYSDTDMTEWFLDEKGDLRAEAAHHDGTNYYLYRVFKDNVTEEQIEDFKDKIYHGTLTEKDIDKYTHRLGDDIAGVYGIELPDIKKSIKKQLESHKAAVASEPKMSHQKNNELEV